MANQIGSFFETSVDREDVAKGIALHLKNFWDPRMRRQIIGYVKESGGPDLTEAVRKAVLILQAEDARRPSA